MANFGLGLAFQGMDELKEATKWIVKSLELNPENMPAIYSLVRLVSETKDFSVAEKVLRQYLMRHPHDHNMAYTLAGMLFKMERYEDVIDIIEKIIAVDPMDARAQSLLKQAKRAMSGEAKTTSAS